MNIFEALKQDHQTQRRLLEKVLETHGDTDEREKFFAQLKAEMLSHAISEERNFYVPLIEHDDTQDLARHSIAEHHELDEFIEQLEKTDFSSPSWLATAKNLGERLTHHLDEEEQEFFKEAKKVLSEQEQKSLGRQFINEKNEKYEEELES